MTALVSCVFLIPGADLGQINSVAAGFGYGPASLSVPLVNGSAQPWFGCHAWCTQSFVDGLGVPATRNAWPASMIFSATPGVNPMLHWLQALAANGLTPVNAGSI